jgi:hypothetical protein
MKGAQETMVEAIDLFIAYAQVSESTQEGRIARLEKMLRDFASGSWTFSHDFNVWRDAHYAQASSADILMYCGVAEMSRERV